MTKTQFENLIQKHMKTLKCTREEAIDVIETDQVIDKGGRTQYDLPEDVEKMAIKYSHSDERKAKSENNMRGKVRAENPTKQGIIVEIAEFLKEKSQFACENVEITNKERQIFFTIGENSYELTLVQKRKPKN